MTASAPRLAPLRVRTWMRFRHRIGRTRQALRQRPRTRRVVLTLSLIVLLVLIGALGRGAVILAAQTQPVFHDSGNITSIAHWGFGPGEIFDFGVEVDNGSSQTVTLRSITLPNGIPAHVQLVHVVHLVGGGMISSMGWPLVMRTGTLDGALLPAHGTTFIVLALTADRPGAYLIGPVTVNGDIPGPLWSTLHVSHTYHQYAIMCPGVTKAQCYQVHAPGLHGA